MKAITIWQPYASLIAAGLKEYETRSWPTRYRGPIAIHSGLRPMRWIMKHSKEEAVDLAIETFGAEALLKLPVGQIIAVGYVADCIKMTQELIDSMSPQELAAGEWQVGHYAWKIDNVRTLNEPIDATGKQGLWDVDLCRACRHETSQLGCAGCDGLRSFKEKGPDRCCFCGGTILPGQGHNPAPLRKDGVCCAGCNMGIVVPERIRRSQNEGGQGE